MILRIIRKRALLFVLRVACWAAERLAEPEVRAKVRELERQEPPR